MSEEYPFVFTKLTDKDEGNRVNRFGRSKSSYLGRKCKQVGVYPPFTFLFEDGAKWALDEDQVSPIDERYRIVTQRYNVPVICVETGEEFHNAREASVAHHVSRSGINTAVNTGFPAGGYHWIRKGEQLL